MTGIIIAVVIVVVIANRLLMEERGVFSNRTTDREEGGIYCETVRKYFRLKRRNSSSSLRVFAEAKTREKRN